MKCKLQCLSKKKCKYFEQNSIKKMPLLCKHKFILPWWKCRSGFDCISFRFIAQIFFHLRSFLKRENTKKKLLEKQTSPRKFENAKKVRKNNQKFKQKKCRKITKSPGEKKNQNNGGKIKNTKKNGNKKDATRNTRKTACALFACGNHAGSNMHGGEQELTQTPPTTFTALLATKDHLILPKKTLPNIARTPNNTNYLPSPRLRDTPNATNPQRWGMGKKRSNNKINNGVLCEKLFEGIKKMGGWQEDLKKSQ